MRIKDRCHGKARGLILTERENRSQFLIAQMEALPAVKIDKIKKSLEVNVHNFQYFLSIILRF